MAVEFSIRDLAGEAISAVKRRGPDTAIILDRARYVALPLDVRVELINTILQRVDAPPATPVLDLLAS